MGELPQGRIEVSKSQHKYPLWLSPDIHSLLRLYAQGADTSMTDAGNRILLAFLTEIYDFKTPREVRKGYLKAIFPTRKVIYDAIVSITRGEKPRRRPIPLRKDGKLPSFLTEPSSSDHGNP